MDNLKSVLDYIKGFFVGPLDHPRKRRAVDPLEDFINTKCRKLSNTMSRNLEDDWFMERPTNIRRSSLFRAPRATRIPVTLEDPIVLDDDDDIIEIRKPEDSKIQRTKSPKYASTPADSRSKLFLNGGDDDVRFVKEEKLPKTYASRTGLFNIKKSTPFQNGTKPSGRSSILGSIMKPRNSMSRSFHNNSLEQTIRLDDKMQYKKLLESASSNNDSSIYDTPVGKLFNYDSSNRSSKILNMVHRSGSENNSGRNESYSSLNGSKDKMSTKDRIIKVLDDFESDQPVVEVRDTDSESDVIICPPSPKPDIKVDPVNSLKKVIDSTEQSKSDWLQDLVQRHRKSVAEREREIKELKESAEKHHKINRDIRLGLLTSKIEKSLSIKDIVLPIEEDEPETELPPLSDDQLRLVDRAFRGDPNEILVRKFNLNISRRDLQTLAGLNWLNDEVINFYMNLLIERGKDPNWPSVHCMNTFFYSKLIKDGPQSLRRWTKKIDIFAQDIICVPIHLGMHWCMSIINLREKSIKYFDSMGGSNNRCLDSLKNYLEAEHLDKKKSEFDTSDFVLENVKDIPQQMNGSDCGMFSCTFAEFLTRNAKITFSQEDMPYLRKKMVVEIMSGQLLIH